MITAAVISDTHTCIARACEAILLCRPDVIIHLGDHDRDADAIHLKFPDIPMYRVCGNCDMAPTAPEKDVIQLGPVKAFLTHGHLYDVRWGIDRLVYAAMEAECSLALFGHTHEALYETVGGVTVINPGTAGKGRNLTWAKVCIFDNGGIACEIQKL